MNTDEIKWPLTYTNPVVDTVGELRALIRGTGSPAEVDVDIDNDQCIPNGDQTTTCPFD